MLPMYYIGVDVGTGSSRACVIDGKGNILATAAKAITRWEPIKEYINQSSTEIWQNVCYCVREVVRISNVDPAQVGGISFDATCSLVVLGQEDDHPRAVGPDFKNDEQNVILWMDHRAVTETQAINATNDEVLKYVGGQMSLEMEIPKIKWLKNHMSISEFKKFKFYDLADFLTHRATNSEARSFCSVVCKQGYLPKGVEGSTRGWSEKFLRKIGLEELAENNFLMLGGVDGLNGQYDSAGDRVGFLSESASRDMGLTTKTAVGSGVIDAYAGWIGTVAAKTDLLPEGSNDDESLVVHRLAAVAGTSTCHLVMSKSPVFVHGVWGPYRDCLIPGLWLAEGGQSLTGELLHLVITKHPSYAELQAKINESGISTFEWLNHRLEELRVQSKYKSVLELIKHRFFYGDFYGNRSPVADSKMRGAVIGEDLDTSIDALALRYLSAVEFIGQQTRHILESLNKAGHDITQIYLSGGQCRNQILTGVMATATGLPIIIPRYIDSAVVFGTAILGARAAHPEMSL